MLGQHGRAAFHRGADVSVPPAGQRGKRRRERWPAYPPTQAEHGGGDSYPAGPARTRTRLPHRPPRRRRADGGVVAGRAHQASAIRTASSATRTGPGRGPGPKRGHGLVGHVARARGGGEVWIGAAGEQAPSTTTAGASSPPRRSTAIRAVPAGSAAAATRNASGQTSMIWRPLYVPHLTGRVWQLRRPALRARHGHHGGCLPLRAAATGVAARHLALGDGHGSYSSGFSLARADQRGSTCSWVCSDGRSSRCTPHSGLARDSRHGTAGGSAAQSTTASRSTGSRSIRSPCIGPSSSSVVSSVVLCWYAYSSWISTASVSLIGRRHRPHSPSIGDVTAPET
jgi:hypothetical protein